MGRGEEEGRWRGAAGGSAAALGYFHGGHSDPAFCEERRWAGVRGAEARGEGGKIRRAKG